MTTITAAERNGVKDVILDVLARHKGGGLTDVRARSAIVAFITSLAPDDFFSEETLSDFEVYIDITLQLNRVSPHEGDPDVTSRLDEIANVGFGSTETLANMHA